MVHIACILLASLVVIDTVSATAIQLLTVDASTCEYETFQLNEYDYYQLNWGGSALPDVCKKGFSGKSFIQSEAHDKYKVCVEAWTFNITDCSVKIRYSSGANPTKEYSCHSVKPPKFCSDEDTDLYIEIESTVTSPSAVRLCVSAVKTFTFERFEYTAIVYAVIGGLSLLCMVIVGIVAMMLYKKHVQGHSRGLVVAPRTTPTGYLPPHTYGCGMQNYAYNTSGQDLYPTQANSKAVSPPDYADVSAEDSKPPEYTSIYGDEKTT